MIRLIDHTLTTAFKRTQIILMAKSTFWLAGVSASQLQKLKFDDCLQAEMHPIWYQVYFVVCKPLNQSGQLKNTPTQNISRMSFFRKVNKCKKATTVVRCLNASYLRYIDFLRNYCYSTSHVPIPPILLACRPHPWNIPQITNINSTNNLKHNTSPLSIIEIFKTSSIFVIFLSPKSTVIKKTAPSRSVDSTLRASHEDLRSTSPTPWP